MKKLFKDPAKGVVGGVLSGLGQYLGVDPALVRVIFVILCFATNWFAGMLIYFLLWHFLPNKNDIGFTDYDMK